MAEDKVLEKQEVGFPVLLVAGRVHDKVEAKLHPVEGEDNLVEPA
jgi:hypothetical protein